MPAVGGVAFAAFVAVVPAILAFCENRETLAGMQQPVAPPPPVVTTTTTTVQPSDLPSKGQL